MSRKTRPETADESLLETQEQPHFHGQTRMRAADYVFETLSRAILHGELAPGSILPTQRELSAQFGVSPLVVRQATHRLEELGLVRVRQGSTTTVLDPNEAPDIRLMQLRVQLARPGDRFALAAFETQTLQTLPILALTERRITALELQELEHFIDSAPESLPQKEANKFRREFWAHIARSSRNPLVEQYVRSWVSIMQDVEQRFSEAGGVVPRNFSKAPYRGILRALRRRRGTVEYWLRSVVEPLFTWTESHATHEMHAQKAQSGLKQARAAR